LNRIRTGLAAILIFIFGFVTSQLFFNSSLAPQTPQTAGKAVNVHAIENIQNRSTKITELTVKDVYWFEKKIAQLENELSVQSKTIESLNRSKHSVMDNKDEVESDPIKFTSMTLDEAETILPKPYSDLVASTGGSMIDYLKEHIKDGVDYEWSSDIEQKFRDFVTMHPLSSEVEIQSITCKISTCEVMIIEYENFTWERIKNDMSKQEWYSFSVGSSSKTLDSKTYIYMMLSK
jgi:hypothetical protein